MMQEKDEKNSEGTEPLYEVGFHIIPTLEENALTDEVSGIREAIESQGGTIRGEGAPEGISLAYPVSKVFRNKRSEFESSYFGWMTFVATPQGVERLEEALQARENILRFLIIKTTEENISLKPSKKMSFITGGADSKKDKKKGDRNEKGGEFSESELDKTLDELVTSDKQ